MIRFKNILLLIFINFFFVLIAFSQKTVVQGRIIDASTKVPLAYVNVGFKGTNIGTYSDGNGWFKIETTQKVDSLIISVIGYVSVTRKVKPLITQVINSELNTRSINISEVVVQSKKKRIKDNPAHLILDSIVKYKNKNGLDNLDYYQYEVYNKVEFDLYNISSKLMKNRLFKQLDFVFNNIDSSEVRGENFLPVFLIESISDFFYRAKPKIEKESVKATKVSGVNNKSFSQFLGDMYQKIDVYENQVNFFGKPFISPLANYGKTFYKYYLTDSAFIDNKWCYQIVFKPKRPEEYVFDGNFWVTDSTYAIKKIMLAVTKDVNLNFVKYAQIGKEYNKFDSTWFLSKDYLTVDFFIPVPLSEGFSFYAKKTASYKDFKTNIFKEDNFYSLSNNIAVAEDATLKTDEYWQQARHDSLSNSERSIYVMIDSIKKLPVYKTMYNLFFMLGTGYLEIGKFEWGPYFTTYSNNPIEGNRFRFSGRTSNNFSKKIMFGGYAAYGTLDEKFKYSADMIWLFNKNPRRGVGFKYKNDLEQLGQSENAFRNDNIMRLFLQKSQNYKLSMVEENNGWYEHEWVPGFSTKFSFTHRVCFPAFDTSFFIVYPQKIVIKDNITTSELGIETRFAFREKFLMGEFDRVSLGTKYPVFTLKYRYGFNNFLNSDFEFHKFNLRVEDWFNIAPIGRSVYILNSGVVLGKLPFILLKMHEGNETYSFDKEAFNMMNYFEFVSDKYLSLYYAHHFNGFFLDKFPLLKKLKFREIIWTKGLIGSLKESNKELMRFPSGLTNVSKPYIEAGVGLENILKFFRVDATWRLSYLENPNTKYFGVFVSMQIIL